MVWVVFVVLVMVLEAYGEGGTGYGPRLKQLVRKLFNPTVGFKNTLKIK